MAGVPPANLGETLRFAPTHPPHPCPLARNMLQYLRAIGMVSVATNNQKRNTTMKMKLKKGFTLVEIMIVVAIIAILAAVAIPNFLKYRADARTQSCVSNMKQLQTAAESWRTTASDPTSKPDLSDLVGTETTKYIRKTVADFHCPEGTTAYEIGTADGGAITVECKVNTDHVLK